MWIAQHIYYKTFDFFFLNIFLSYHENNKTPLNGSHLKLHNYQVVFFIFAFNVKHLHLQLCILIWTYRLAKMFNYVQTFRGCPNDNRTPLLLDSFIIVIVNLKVTVMIINSLPFSNVNTCKNSYVKMFTGIWTWFLSD